MMLKTIYDDFYFLRLRQAGGFFMLFFGVVGALNRYCFLKSCARGLFYSLANFWPIDRTCYTLRGYNKQGTVEAKFPLIEGGNASQVHFTLKKVSKRSRAFKLAYNAK